MPPRPLQNQYINISELADKLREADNGDGVLNPQEIERAGYLYAQEHPDLFKRSNGKQFTPPNFILSQDVLNAVAEEGNLMLRADIDGKDTPDVDSEIKHLGAALKRGIQSGLRK